MIQQGAHWWTSDQEKLSNRFVVVESEDFLCRNRFKFEY